MRKRNPPNQSDEHVKEEYLVFQEYFGKIEGCGAGGKESD